MAKEKKPRLVSVIKEGALRVWWIPQIPMSNPFYVYVTSIKMAKKILDVLANYDLYQFENNVKPDYSNVGGLEIFEGTDSNTDPPWVEWYNKDGFDIYGN